MNIFIVMLLLFVIYIIFYKNDTKKKRNKLQQYYRNIKLFETTLTSRNLTDLRKYPILYINLKDSVERRISIEYQANMFGIVPQRINAVDYRSIDRAGWSDTKKKEHACSLSHLRAMNYAFQKGWDVVIILEDDVFFILLHYWPETLSELIKRLDPSWELLNLSSMNNGMGKTPYLRKGIKFGAVGYCVHRRGLKKIQGFNSGNRHLRADQELYRFFFPNAYFTTFPFFIPCNISRRMGSTIHDSHTDGHIRKSIKWVERLRSLRS